MRLVVIFAAGPVRHMWPSCRSCGWIGDHLPGSGGLRPPRASIARAMRAAGLWNLYEILVRTRILVFTDSIRPLLSPWSRVAWMLGRCLRIFFPSSTNSGMRQRAARDSQRVRSFLPSSPLSLNAVRSPSLSRQARYRQGWVFSIQASLASWRPVRFSGVFRSAQRARARLLASPAEMRIIRLPCRTGVMAPAWRAVRQTSRRTSSRAPVARENDVERVGAQDCLRRAGGGRPGDPVRAVGPRFDAQPSRLPV